MTCELIAVELTDEQKGHICGVLSVGCDRQTAADFVGCSLADIRRAMQCDPAFSQQVCRAEAGVELYHMRVVQDAAKDVKNWKASVWWLERRFPERYGGRMAGVVTSRQLQAFIAILVDLLNEEIDQAADRERLFGRLRSMVRAIDQLLCDDRESQLSPADSIGASLSDVADGIGDEILDADSTDADGLDG